MVNSVVQQLESICISGFKHSCVRLCQFFILASVTSLFSMACYGQTFETSIDYTMYRLATEHNDPSAQYLVGRNFFKGKSVEKDIKEAIKWFEMAAKQNHIRAQYQLGKIFLYGEGIKPNLSQAYYYLSKAAEKNHLDSQYELGNYYLQGEPNQRQYAKAVKWFRRAAARDHVRSLYALGKLVYEGKGTDPDPGEAKRLLRLAAESGLLEAANYLNQLENEDQSVLANINGDKQNVFDGLDKTLHSPNDYYKQGIAFLTGDYGDNKENALRKAALYFQKASEQNHGKAQYQLAKLYSQGIGVEQNEKLHRQWLTKAADAGVQSAIRDLRNLQEREVPIVQRNSDDNPEHEPGNDPDDQYILALKYYQGDGLPRDRDKAAAWFAKAAQQDHADAQYQLGLMYREGVGVEKNLEKAKHWLEKAASNNVPAAELALKTMARQTPSEPKNVPLATKPVSIDNDPVTSQLIPKKASPIYAFLQHAREGDRTAQYEVALKYLNGEGGVKRDVDQAIKWLKESARNNYTEANTKLGMLYYQGIEVERDYRSAASWMENAARNGDAEAQFLLGDLYREGLGVEKNNSTAILWYRKAANQGHREARKRLGGCRIC